MNPNQPNTGLNLPPVMEVPSPAPDAASESSNAALPEQASSPSVPAASTPPPAILPIPPMAQASSDNSSVTATDPAQGTPASVDDKDLIEKEWVERAKRIVEQTRDDPHKQSEELTVVKADYMKTHYNKTIKLTK